MNGQGMMAVDLMAALSKLPPETPITFVDSGYDDDYTTFYEWSVSLFGSRINLVSIIDTGSFDDYDE